MKILIVEDHLDLLEIMQITLSRQNFMVDSATDGDTAFQKARDNQYDLILLDLTLPGKSGFEIITALRSLQVMTPILVVSGRSMVADRIQALNLGADDYLLKDFSHQELLARVKSVIRRSHGDAKNIYTCGNLTLNLSDMVVRRGSQLLTLTKKEFILLTELIRRKGKVTPTEVLIQAAWGENGNQVLSNKLNVHIRQLRKKIDEPFKHALIHTRRGFGYKLEDQS